MMAKARLHWFWRGAIAAVAGAAGLLAITIAINSIASAWGPTASEGAFRVFAVTAYLAMPLPGIVVYGLLSRRFGPTPPDGELHCRRCHHILRGLSEPRCPECGEAI